VRMFFALWPDDDTRARIANAAAGLRLSGDVRFAPPENYHLTLAFVGAADESGLAVLQQVGRAQQGAACTIRFDAYDYWPDPRVVVASAREPPPALTLLWTRLRQDLTRQHAVLTRLHLHPLLRAHITLARKVVQAPVLQAMSPLCWNARSFSLVRSDPGSTHSAYTVVDTWPLLDESPKL
jgi:RNA 2',3'-cyclic 3'-phosphodiesterase